MNRYKTEHEEKLEKAIQETPYHVIPRLCLIVVPLDHLIIKKIAAHVDLSSPNVKDEVLSAINAPANNMKIIEKLIADYILPSDKKGNIY